MSLSYFQLPNCNLSNLIITKLPLSPKNVGLSCFFNNQNYRNFETLHYYYCLNNNYPPPTLKTVAQLFCIPQPPARLSTSTPTLIYVGLRSRVIFKRLRLLTFFPRGSVSGFFPKWLRLLVFCFKRLRPQGSKNMGLRL